MASAWKALVACLLVAGATASIAADEDETPPLDARQQAIADRIDAVARGFAASSDPAIRAMFSFDGIEQSADGMYRPHETVPAARLVEEARGSTDPLTLDVLLWRCRLSEKSCDELALATRWVEADTQNQVAWLALAAIERARGDATGAREAFVRASRASVWHAHYNDAVRRIAAALPRDLSPPERAAALSLAFGKASAAIPFPVQGVLGRYCAEAGSGGDAPRDELRDACLRIVATMVRDGDDLAGLMVAAPYAARAGADPTIVAAYWRKRDALSWVMPGLFEPAFGPPFPEDSPALRAALVRIDARIAVGERRRLEQLLAERHLDETDAARRYVATLSVDQTRRRNGG